MTTVNKHMLSSDIARAQLSVCMCRCVNPRLAQNLLKQFHGNFHKHFILVHCTWTNSKINYHFGHKF